jgi:hypothetical protein
MKDYFSSRRGEERVLLDFWGTITFFAFWLIIKICRPFFDWMEG